MQWSALRIAGRVHERESNSNSLKVAVTTDAKPNPLGRTATQEWNQPLDSFKKRNEMRAITGNAEVMTMSQ